MAIDRARLTVLGRDGVATLALSAALLLASGGLSLLYPLYVVVTAARRAATGVPCPAPVAVFGKRLRAGHPDPEFHERLERARALYAAGLTRRILLLGGTTDPGAVSEAQAGAAHLRAGGVPEAAIELEQRSRHTLENLDQMRRLVGEGGERWVFLSSRYHLARCSVLARGFGLPHTLCAAEERLRWSGALLPLLGEALYLHWYWVGKGWSRLTGNRNSLARIS